MWSLQLIDPVNNLFYHEVMMDLNLGWTSIHQDSQIKGASLHPLLFSQCIKGGVIAKLGLHDVREAVKEQNSKGYKVIGTSGFGASESQVMSNGLRVMGLLNKATTFRFSSLYLKSSQVGGIPNVGGVTRQHAKGDIGDCYQQFLW